MSNQACRPVVVSLLFASAFQVVAAVKLPDWLALKGYIDLQEAVTVTESPSMWTNGITAQNRLDISLYPTGYLTFAASLRSRLLYGPRYSQLFPFGYKGALRTDPGLVDLSRNLWDNNSAVLNATVDRLYADLAIGQWQFRIGRHRINWGKNLVWNPNDLFNAYSVFDVSYEEGPGTDALLVRRYLGPAGSAELVVAGANKADSAGVAALVQINHWGFDLQMLGGWQRHDAILGVGFTGQLGGAAVRGEVSVFAADSFAHDPQTVASFSADNTLPFSLYAQVSMLYNSDGLKTFGHYVPMTDFASRLSARNLSPAQLQLFAQLSYPVTPLFETGLSTIVNPRDWSAVLMPLAKYSLADNVDATLQAQVQIGDKGEQYGADEHAVYFDVRWSF